MYNIKINYGPDINTKLCSGCKNCYNYCPQDVFSWDEENNTPIVSYPGECDMCCFCEIGCPEIAIDVKIPLHNLLDFCIAPVDYKKIYDTFEE